MLWTALRLSYHQFGGFAVTFDRVKFFFRKPVFFLICDESVHNPKQLSEKKKIAICMIKSISHSHAHSGMGDKKFVWLSFLKPARTGSRQLHLPTNCANETYWNYLGVKTMWWEWNFRNFIKLWTWTWRVFDTKHAFATQRGNKILHIKSQIPTRLVAITNYKLFTSKNTLTAQSKQVYGYPFLPHLGAIKLIPRWHRRQAAMTP